jgi:hypothetical protein
MCLSMAAVMGAYCMKEFIHQEYVIMWEYYGNLMRKFNLEVLPLIEFLRYFYFLSTSYMRC